MNSNILEIWANIEQSNETGLLKRLYTNDSELYIYAVFQNPEKHCGIALSFDKSIHIDVSTFSNLRDLQVTLTHDNSFLNNNMLVIKLLHCQSRDIFAVMCENMIQSVLSLRSEKQVVRTIINQLEKWQGLFEKLKGEGLTPSEQQGLYGELHFLQKFIAKQEVVAALNSWVGTDREVRDFQYNDWAVEVKTTAGNNHQKVSISNERQLDETLLGNLFLFHLSVEAANKNGESLNAKVNSIRETLQDNVSALNLFNNKLLEIGYFEKHIHLYEEKCYQVRDENYYKIDGDFPRIKEKEIRNGVGDVKYSIILSQCDEYLISENTVFEKINNL
ncbi:MAG: PD-(D/E)XK motif protein [Bacteroidetes bacterium]|nr:PD-(D/E)XK motif protein [Bacteroidota bacterium]